MHRIYYRISGTILFLAGIFLIVNSQATITGAVIGAPLMATFNTVGILLVVISIVLFATSRIKGKAAKRSEFQKQ